MYITSDQIVLRREAALPRITALCLKQGGGGGGGEGREGEGGSARFVATGKPRVGPQLHSRNWKMDTKSKQKKSLQQKRFAKSITNPIITYFVALALSSLHT